MEEYTKQDESARAQPWPGRKPPGHDELRDMWLERTGAGYAYGMGEWREYFDGIWSPTEELEVKGSIENTIEAAKTSRVNPTSALLSSVTELARVKRYVPKQAWDADPDILVCQNGTLRISTRELGEHKPEHYTTSGVPYQFNSSAVANTWRDFLGDVVSEAVAEFLQEFAGYALTTPTEHEVALWLYGPRGSGKSTFLAGLEAMLGARAGVLGLADLEKNRFALSNIPGKTLLVAAEQPSSFLSSTSILDAIISGDTILVEKKYKDAYEIQSRAKIAWAMNELPRVASPNAGIFRRVKVVKFGALDESKRDPTVKRMIRDEGSGILNWALDGLDRLNERGSFDIPPEVQTTTEEFRESNDKPAMFLEDRTETAPGEGIQARKLYSEYAEWCHEHGYEAAGERAMRSEWERLGLKRITPKGIKHYKGRRILPSGDWRG